MNWWTRYFLWLSWIGAGFVVFDLLTQQQSATTFGDLGFAVVMRLIYVLLLRKAARLKKEE